MRAFKAIVIVIVVLVAMASLVPYAVSPYIRFMGKAPSYYTHFALACDSLLKQYPIGAAGFVELSPSEPMLPGIIRALHARKISLSTNGVAILVGVGRGGFGISWGPDDMHDNYWTLETNGEGLRKAVFSELKKLPFPNLYTNISVSSRSVGLMSTTSTNMQ